MNSLTLFGVKFVDIGCALGAFDWDHSGIGPHILITSRNGEALPTATDWLLACYDADGECLHFFSNGGGPMVRSALESAQ